MRFTPNIAFSGLVVLLVVFSGDAFAEDNTEESGNTTRYTVDDDDTLGSIALQFGVDVDDVREWNGIDDLDVPAGEQLVVKSDEKKTGKKKALPVIHVVKQGDTFEDIARQYGVSISKVKRWNRGVNPRRLQLGQQLRLYVPGRDGRSVSYGKASGGRLYNGVALQDGPGLKVRNIARAYGTERTVNMLRAAAADVKARWPNAPSIVIGDVSHKQGGYMRPHKSHQSGRDVDGSYFYRGNVQTPDFYEMNEYTFDAAKNWHFFKTLIDTGEVSYIFINRNLQKMLYEYARSIGYEDEDLEEILQYPRPSHVRQGIIRHAKGHGDHFHIRFSCEDGDRHCSDY